MAGHSRPEALGSAGGYSVRPRHRLLWPHPSHLTPPRSLFASSARHHGGKWVPNLICESCCTCHPQYPGGSSEVHTTVASPTAMVFALFARARHPQRRDRWFSRGQRHEADSGSLSLRPAQLLALHQQGRLLPSFPWPGHPEPESVITTRATVNSRGRTFTGKTRSRMGCEQRRRGAKPQRKRQYDF